MVRKSSKFKRIRQVDTRTPISTISSVLISSFHPKKRLFAMAMNVLDSYNICIFDVVTGLLKTSFSLDKGWICRSLSWGIEIDYDKKTRLKKRKAEDEDTYNNEKDVLYLGLSNGEIILFSITLNKIFMKLVGGHTQSVTGITFSNDYRIGWSCGLDGKIVEWDLLTSKILNTFSFELLDSLTAIMYYNSKIICASHNICVLNLPLLDILQTFNAHITYVDSLLVCSDSDGSIYCFSASKEDRFINMFLLNEEESKNVGVLVTEDNVKALTFSTFFDKTILAVLTTSGIVNIFHDLFDKSFIGIFKQKNSLIRQPISKIIAFDEATSTQIEIVDIGIQDDNIIIVLVNGVTFIFETVSYLDNDKNFKQGEIRVSLKKSDFLKIHVNGVSSNIKSYNESNATVISGDDMRNLDDDEISQSSEDNQSEKNVAKAIDELTLSEKLEKLEMKSSKPSEISVKVPSAKSLISLLIQALQVNDKTLLESCLNCQDSETVLATVKRLESPLAVLLLERIAERLSKQPSRASSLSIWIRWTIIIHGGYLVTLPNLMKTLSTLQLTLLRCASALPRLLALHGRLDMINAQIKLRKEYEPQNEESESGIEYVEGEDDSDEDMLTIDDTTRVKNQSNNNDNDVDTHEIDDSGYDTLDDNNLRNSNSSTNELLTEEVSDELSSNDVSADEIDDELDEDEDLEIFGSASDSDYETFIQEKNLKQK
ncbi:hypothetical protein T552_00323 [Pneumocystis carinii B80]|uniref:Small-subunit processome Utp12 domain-containing protein n=1 Tax=Pneumocystis carinii (strain B80) TaxID=1408658 RepID=A0A0W4ZQG6_PNEC8|nr:hypothetical protein T552_00323 [Pneumocystis carinii B80]KTW30607.1 hypothetical protein T552_00323 [Pneumocystis carinii B80]